MSVREYIGARYVPMFANPIDWDSTKTYEPLTIVYHQGNSYTSRQYVPVGIEITNNTYWALTGNYNAQIEAYRAEVRQFDGRIDELENTLEGKFDSNGKLAANEVITESITNGAVTNSKIADNSINSSKIVDGSVTNSKIADNSINSSKIVDGSVTSKDLAHNEVIVILGDSWSANSVPDSVWYETIQTMFNNAEIHNYAVNGCHSSDGTFQAMYNAFVNDTSFDKATITRVILLYGVNDCYTYPVSVETVTAAIRDMYNAIIGQIPNHVNIHWFINFAWGKYSKSFTDQMRYWNSVEVNLQKTRIIPHPMWSWFNQYEMNQTNFFHLTQNASRYHLAHNIYACLTGGTIIKYPSYSEVINDTDILIKQNIEDTYVDSVISWPVSSQTINISSYVLNTPMPQYISSYITHTIVGGYMRWRNASSDAANINRFFLLATSNSPVNDGDYNFIYDKNDVTIG